MKKQGCESCPQKGEVSAHGGSIKTLKDLNNLHQQPEEHYLPLFASEVYLKGECTILKRR